MIGRFLSVLSDIKGVGRSVPRSSISTPLVVRSGQDWKAASRSYKSVKQLGRGAFGKAFAARRKGSRVIVKVASPMRGIVSEREAFVALAREAAILIELQKLPFTPKVIEVGKDYFVQEDAGGESMLNILAKRGLTASELLSVTAAAGIMISAIHKAGFAHRDLEPRNILLTPKGTMIIDFGIAVAKGENERAYKIGMSKDIVSLMENVVLAGSSRGITDEDRVVLASVIEDFRKRVIEGRVDEYTGKELAERLLFILAQLGSRAKRGGKIKESRVKVAVV